MTSDTIRALDLLNQRCKDIGVELARIEASRQMWEIRLNEIHKAIALIQDDDTRVERRYEAYPGLRAALDELEAERAGGAS